MATETQSQQTPAPAVQRELTDPPIGAPVPMTQTIPLTLSEYQRLLNLERQLADFHAQQKAALEAKETEKAKALAEKGQIEDAFKLASSQWETKLREATEKHSQLEQQIFAEKKSALLRSAFADRKFLGDTPEQVAKKQEQLFSYLGPKFDVKRDADGNVVIFDKASLRPAADVLKEAIASQDYDHFFAPTSRGGTGSDATRPPANQQQQQLSVKDVADAWRTEQAKIAGQQSFGMFGVNK